MATERIQISVEDNVKIADVFQGLLDDDVELIDLPESFSADGKSFPITTETLVSGLRSQLRNRNKKLRYAIAKADIDGAFYEGVEVRPSKEGDEVYLRLSTGENIHIHPSAITPGAFEELLESATPHSAEDFGYYIRDILDDFSRDLITSTDYSYDGWGGEQHTTVIEKRSLHTRHLVTTLQQLNVDVCKTLADDYSKNLAVQNIAAILFEEMNANPNPQAYATWFASSWLELRFQQEIALRTRVDREFQKSDFAENTYEPGSQKSVPKGMTVLKPNVSL